MSRFLADVEFEDAHAGIKKSYTSLSGPASYGGLGAAASRFPHQKRTRLAQALSGIDSYSRHKQWRPVHRFNPYVVRVPLQLVQLDLLDVKLLAENNDGVKFLLMILDTFSRRAWAFPLLNKLANTVKNAFERFLDTVLSKPQRLAIERVLCDRGKEFDNGLFKNFLRQRNIILSHPNAHAPHVERLNRSVQRILYSYLSEKGTKRYINRLSDIMRVYNSRPHSAHGLPPVQALAPRNTRRVNYVLEAKLLDRIEPDQRPLRFKPGDYVRLRKKKLAFDRSYQDTHEQRLLRVRDVVRGPLPVPMYRLVTLLGENVRGKYYANQLAAVRPHRSMFRVERVVQRRRGAGRRPAMVLVRWQGYSKAYDTWLRADELRRWM